VYTWPTRLLLVMTLVLAIGGCGDRESSEPAAVPFTKVDLPAGAAPVVLAETGNELLIGVRREGQPVVPGLLRRGRDGAVAEVPVRGVSPYGLLARWRSIASDGERILAIGGEHGGAHGHVRWSVWAGSTAELAEQPQGFSTFGGYEAGDMVGAMLTPNGGALVGAWASARQGFDVAIWTADGADWIRQSSAGTALESAPDSLGFPMAAAALRRGILVTGWGWLSGRQHPLVWRSSSGNTGWTRAALPDSGQAGTAVAVRCWGDACGVAGRVDGNLAVWRLAGDEWARLAGLPPIAVGDRDRLAAPLEVDGQLTQVISDGGRVRIARAGGNGWTVRTAAGPAGTVTAAIRVGDTVFLLAGPDEDSQTLWRTELESLR
jgi:hypothetical protein